MTAIAHQAIAASAGSGKTFQLAHRFIRLLAEGVAPDRIIALTFSRKAAGEIFDSIIQVLRLAVAGPEQARRTAEQIRKPGLKPVDFHRLLRETIDALHRLRIGTLDSFTVGVVRAFPMELGVAVDFEVMDDQGAGAAEARQEVLELIFNHQRADRRALDDFLQAFKQATFGQELKGLRNNLLKFLTDYQKPYRLVPRAEAWGQAPAIWPTGNDWLQGKVDLRSAVDRVAGLLEKSTWPEKVRERWREFLAAAESHAPGMTWTNELEYLFAKLMTVREGLEKGRAAIKLDRSELTLTAEWCAPVWDILTQVMQVEIGTALTRTRGIFRILHRFEETYDREVRRKGRLTFEDAQFLLTGANQATGGARLSRQARAEARLYIDYRLDCKLDHWLLDEFQDTSDMQWSVLENLVDEIVQDTEGRRSFFYVGDVKQAIYAWRGGNAWLFEKILERYGDRIERRPLNTSFRCGQAVVETVNRVFGELPSDPLPAGAAAEWRKVWHAHQSDPSANRHESYVSLREPPSRGGAEKPNEEDRCRLVADLLKDIMPLRRGLSVGVLVRANKFGKLVTDILRAECPDMAVAHEGQAPLLDNPVVSVMLSLVRFAAHPGDLFSRRHLEMSPLGKHLRALAVPAPEWSLVLLREIQSEGFRAFLSRWGRCLHESAPLGPFAAARLQALLDAAGEFDRRGDRDGGRFLRFIEQYQVQEPETGAAVRVMTIHQAKGLTFDLVMLPDLQGRGGPTGGGEVELVVARESRTNHPRWVLKMPRRVVAEQDAVLAEQLRLADEEAAFESLSVLYVAMTRPRYGLYLVTSFPGKTATAFNHAALIKLQLCGKTNPIRGEAVPGTEPECDMLYEHGQPKWFEVFPISKKRTPSRGRARPGAPARRKPSPGRRLVRVSPSRQAEEPRAAGLVFAPATSQGLVVGTAVHELFEKLAWIDEADQDALAADWRKSASWPAAVQDLAVSHFVRALSSPEVRRALSRPAGHVELWREKSFEIVLEDRWITGTFDRVTLVRSAAEKYVSAALLDYKTNEAENEEQMRALAARYRPQLALYGEVLARMLGLRPDRILLQLLFTQTGRVWEMENPTSSP